MKGLNLTSDQRARICLPDYAHERRPDQEIEHLITSWADMKPHILCIMDLASQLDKDERMTSELRNCIGAIGSLFDLLSKSIDLSGYLYRINDDAKRH